MAKKIYIVIDSDRAEDDEKREIMRGTLHEFDAWYSENRKNLSCFPHIEEENKSKKYFVSFKNAGKQHPKFKIGDVVTYTNDYGVRWPNRTVTGIEYWDTSNEPRYFYTPHDAYWYSVPESSLILQSV